MRMRHCRISCLLPWYICIQEVLTVAGKATTIDEAQIIKKWTTDSHADRPPFTRRDKQARPSPIVAGISQYWEGNDGFWSSFVLQVGNRSQEVRVLPSTASSFNWVVYGDPGCNNVPVADCPTSRGKTFTPNNSLTWTPMLQSSIYDLGVEENLIGRKVYGEFGYDSVSLGYPGGGGPTVQRSILAGIGDTHFTWLGALGLNPRPTNFTNMPGSPQSSFVQSLKDNGDIPSISWAYTAGAHYKQTPIFGSLVFGGYDKSRFGVPSTTDPTLTFPFYSDIERDLSVTVSSITTTNKTNPDSPLSLLTEGILALIDSTVPHLWLPEKVCAQFERAFGLTWDNNTELYKLTKTQHDALVAQDPSIVITLTPSSASSNSNKSQSVAITFPYSAFDLNVSWPIGDGPYKNESTFYFPLKRAKDASQYTLGRTFLQEAYIIADYERQNFSVWPCQWDDKTTHEDIVAIPAKTSLLGPSENGGKKISTGIMAGAVAGAFVAAVFLGFMVWLYMRHRRRQHPAFTESASLDLSRRDFNPSQLSPDCQKSSLATELASSPRHELHDCHRFEAEPGGKFELDDQCLPHEAGVQEKSAMYEMDAGSDGVGLTDSRGQLIRITVEPATALSPRPESVLPNTPSEESMKNTGLDMDSHCEVSTNFKNGEDKEMSLEVSTTNPSQAAEQDGVRSFFGFLKAFRVSGRT